MSRRPPLGILCATVFLVMLSFGIIIPNLVYYAEDLHATEAQVGLLMASYSFFQFLFSPIWGRFSDRFGRRPTILVGLAGNALGLYLFGTASDLPGLFLARSLSGALTAAALPTAMAYVADSTDEGGRGRGMGLLGASIGLGFILGPPIGGALARWGHGTPFLVGAAVSAATFLFALALLPESLRADARPQHRPAWTSPARLVRGGLAPYYVLAFFATFTMAGLETTLPFLVDENLGVGAAALGWMMGFMGLAVALFQGGALGRLINRHGEEAVLLAGLLVNAAGFFLITTAAGVVGMTLYLTVAGVGNQILRPTNSSLISKRTTTGQGEAIGAMNSMDALGRVIGPFVAGYLYPLSSSLPYYLGALLLSLVFLGVSLSRARPEASAGDGA
ncbi:MAG: MFS transporter [Acidobacteriota bacterium]|jgi:multidrug resistance protein